MQKTNYCEHLNAQVGIETCMDCHLLCIYNPRIHPAGRQSSFFILRWSQKEIDKILDNGGK